MNQTQLPNLFTGKSENVMLIKKSKLQKDTYCLITLKLKYTTLYIVYRFTVIKI